MKSLRFYFGGPLVEDLKDAASRGEFLFACATAGECPTEFEWSIKKLRERSEAELNATAFWTDNPYLLDWLDPKTDKLYIVWGAHVADFFTHPEFESMTKVFKIGEAIMCTNLAELAQHRGEF